MRFDVVQVALRPQQAVWAVDAIYDMPSDSPVLLGQKGRQPLQGSVI